MRALKLLVGVLSLLLVVGVAALVWGVVRQANKLSEPPDLPPPINASPVVADERVPWQQLLLKQPRGSRVAGVNSAGDLIILQLFTDAPGRDERLLVIDPGSGTLLGTILVTEPP